MSRYDITFFNAFFWLRVSVEGLFVVIAGGLAVVDVVETASVVEVVNVVIEFSCTKMFITVYHIFCLIATMTFEN